MQYTVKISEEQRVMINVALENHPETGHSEKLALLVGMVKDLPANEVKSPGALHDFTA